MSVADGPFGPLEVPIVAGVVRRLDPGGEGIVVDATAIGLDEAAAAPQARAVVAGPRRPCRRAAEARGSSLRP